MPQTATHVPGRLGLIAIAIVFLVSVNAAADDIRIGRYQTVAVGSPLEEIEVAPRFQPTALPENVATRGDALRWIVQQHGYQLHDDAQRLLDLTELLTAPLSANQRPAGTLRAALRSLLDHQLPVLIDSDTREVSLSMNSASIATAGDVDASE